MLNYSNSKVTMELRDVLASTDENGKPFDLWDFDYPSYYQGDAKRAFEQKVIDHYLFHQIGVETIARFKHNFRTRIREVMPYYLQYYKSVELMEQIDDPFGNIDITETFEQTSSDTATGSASATSTTNTSDRSTETITREDGTTANDDFTRKFSNTPQGSISNLDNYMTDATVENRERGETLTSTGEGTTSRDADGNTESSQTSESESSGTVKHTLTRKGNQGVNTYAHDMIELRQSFINVDMMIIGALRDLFLLIY